MYEMVFFSFSQQFCNLKKLLKMSIYSIFEKEFYFIIFSAYFNGRFFQFILFAVHDFSKQIKMKIPFYYQRIYCLKVFYFVSSKEKYEHFFIYKKSLNFNSFILSYFETK